MSDPDLLVVLEIPYCPTPQLLFDELQHLEGAVWLDSGWPHFSDQRYDIITAQPLFSVSPENNSYKQRPFEHLRQRFHEVESTTGSNNTTLPFTHGFMGYFGYDVGTEEISVVNANPPVLGVQKYFWAYFNYSFVFDHQEQKAYFSRLDSLNHSTLCQIESCIKNYTNKLSTPNVSSRRIENLLHQDFSLEGFKSIWSYEDYKAAFDQIKNHIEIGNIYQANLTQTFTSKFRGNPYWAYCALREIMPAPYGCYASFGKTKVLSFSPETFLKKSGEIYVTRPIKGTRPRGSNYENDQRIAQELKSSAKDQAENLMIVDLLRNDLSMKATKNSVKVEELYTLKSYANVHHLESLISAEITQVNGLEVFKDCFPGGSITGAPKRRACEIIAELEASPREIYCGAIGYLNASGDFDTNIAIRTITCHEHTMSLSGGGGIVSDSTANAEYEESLAKIQRLIDGLKNFYTVTDNQIK